MTLGTSDFKIINVPRGRVWRAWTTPDQVRRWNKLRAVVLPERVGGALYWRYDFSGTHEHVYLARLSAVEPGVSCRYEWYGETGDPPTTVHMRLSKLDGGARTELCVEHTGFAEGTRGRLDLDASAHHWAGVTERLAAYLENRPNAHRHPARTGLVPRGGVPEVGMVVRDVAAGSAARDAGLVAGDVVRAIDGIRMTCIEDFHAWLDQAEPGRTALFELQDRTVAVVPRAPAPAR